MNDLVKRLAKLPADRRAQILALLREESAVSAVPEPRERDATTPLSFNQETLWFVTKLAEDQPTYNLPVCYRLIGPLDVDAFRRAMTTVVARHDMLRVSLADGPDGPVQTVLPEIDFEVPVVEVAGDDIAQRREAAQEFVDEFNAYVFSLEQAPLWRVALVKVAPDEHWFCFVVHHVAFDGWSLSVLCAELNTYYGVEIGEIEAPEEPAGRLDYPDYALWQRDWLTEDNLAEHIEFWRKRLSDAPTLEFPTDRPRPPELTYHGTELPRFVPVDTRTEAARLARSLNTSPNTVYTAAFFALLHRYTGQHDLVIGAPSANRSFAEVESVMGYFVNMLVLRADVTGDPTFRELIAQVRGEVQEAFAHGALPFGKLVETIQPARDASRSAIFQIAFTFQNTGEQLLLPGLEIDRNLKVGSGTSRFDMSWNVYEEDNGLNLIVEYSTDLFDRETIDALINDFATVLRAGLANPDLRLSKLPLLTDEARAALRDNWNGPTREVAPSTIPHLFAAQVAARPDEVAVISGDRQLSYAELDRRANQLANLLVAQGAGPDKLVALCLPRVPELTIAIMAVLKAGAAYVPLDPANPPARLATLLADCAPVALLTMERSGANLPEQLPPVIRLDADADRIDAASEAAPPLTAGPTNLAYVIYTSGSTGTPKGVLIEHQAVVNFIGSVRELFALTPADRVLGFASATFDVSVFETFSALLTGARLYLTADDERLDVDRLQELLAEWAITVTDLPPSLMALLEPERLPALRIAFVGGEAFPGELVNRWNPGRRFFNGYGPTECTVTMIVQECAGTWDVSPPIGLPMANHVAHVLDAHGEPVPIGVPGELVIGGAGLARGYLNQPELTAEKFYPDPFGTAPGGRLYRTGDLVKRRRDGALVFLGRIDKQVKIRGLRIELGEIEAVLGRLPEVDQVAVEPYQDPQGVKHLVAYVASRTKAPDPSELRDWLASQLPAYMVPSHFMVLDSLPLTNSGKIERRLLPAPDATDTDDDGPIEYANALERTLAEEIVGPVLGLDRVRPHQNFFEMGGHSLAAARVVSRIRSQYSVEITLADFFRAPTVAMLAELLESRRAASAANTDLLEILESMTDEEAAALLADVSGQGQSGM